MCGKLGNCIEDSTEGDDNGVVEEKLSTLAVPISFFSFLSLHYANATYQWPRFLGVLHFCHPFFRDLYHGQVFVQYGT